MKRRDFLQVIGLTLTASGLQFPFAELTEQPAYGRVLERATIHTHPNQTASVLTHYLPDSVQPIWGAVEGWFRVPDGFVIASQMQPMLPRIDSPPTLRVPAYVEVIAPFAAVRSWGSAHAPLVARLGHGAVIKAEKHLAAKDGQVWLKTVVAGQIGWLQAVQVHPIQLTSSPPQTHAYLEGYRLTVFQGKTALGNIRVNRPAHLPRGQYRIQTHLPTAGAGIPWVLLTDQGIPLHGVYWHNTFSGDSTTNAIELPLIPAKWLYTMLPNGAYLTVY